MGSVLVISATAFAQSYHKGQLYGSQDYFEKHVCGVADMLIASGASELEVVVGLLHDVVEDTTAELVDIKTMFGVDVANSVDAITKRDGESTIEYLERCALDDVACKVKMFDSLFNLSESQKSGDMRRIFKYLRNINVLVKAQAIKLEGV